MTEATTSGPPEGSHVIMVSQPQAVLHVIVTAAGAVASPGDR